MQIDTDKIVRAFEENPVIFMGAAGAVLMAFGKIIEATGNYRGSSAYARDVNRRVRQSRKGK